jgi:hypothetical protein
MSFLLSSLLGIVFLASPQQGLPIHCEPSQLVPALVDGIKVFEASPGQCREVLRPYTVNPLFDDFMLDPGKKTASCFAVIPRTRSDYSALFPGEPFVSSAKLMTVEVSNRVEKNKRFTAPPSASIDAYIHFLKRTPSRFVLIVGHNDAGRFIFPTGESLDLVAMAQMAKKGGKFPIFISCMAKEYLAKGDLGDTFVGLKGDITYYEAVDVAEAIASYIEKGTSSLEEANETKYSTRCLYEVFGDLDKILQRVSSRMRLKYRVACILGSLKFPFLVTGLIILWERVFSSEEEESKANRLMRYPAPVPF